jgi:hypothetical protein
MWEMILQIADGRTAHHPVHFMMRLRFHVQASVPHARRRSGLEVLEGRFKVIEGLAARAFHGQENDIPFAQFPTALAAAQFLFLQRNDFIIVSPIEENI